ncbi:MAG: YceD family protein [Gammaproteobacteria bacterium]|nr:YceD family protein [Gammaproteobacteria bacterium]
MPDRIEPARLAEQGARIEGRVALGGMERLAPLLAAEAGDAEVEMVFAIDGRGLRTVHGRVRATVPLTCQRCLKPVACAVDCDFHLAVVASDTEERRLPEGIEPLDGRDASVATAALVEDEVLLGLPLVALHPDPACNDDLERWQGEGKAAAENPFGVLKEWQDKRGRN